MARQHKPFTDPGYRFGHDPADDLDLIAWMLHGHCFYEQVALEAPWNDAHRIAGEAARALIGNPFQVSVGRFAHGPDADLDLLKLAYPWPGGQSSLQVLLARDDRGRYSVVTVLDGAPVNGEPGRHGRLLYGASEPCRNRQARMPQPDALLDPLERLGGFPGMTFDPLRCVRCYGALGPYPVPSTTGSATGETVASFGLRYITDCTRH